MKLSTRRSGYQGNEPVMLVSCGRRKEKQPCAAKDMYNSPRFRGLKNLAEACGISWFILSARYVLLSPNDVIGPYDLDLEACNENYRKEWASRVAEKYLAACGHAPAVLVADGNYARKVAASLAASGVNVVAPFAFSDEEEVSSYVLRATHAVDVANLYDLLYDAAAPFGGVGRFGDCTSKMPWPKRGVYFFVDFNEPCLLSGTHPRIVRVGTHAVSRGSKSTLWHRLKTHKGTKDGGGNHRGSIFRLHVGRALMAREGIECSTWGAGQSASKDIREAEHEVEQMVSSYIGNLGVIAINVDDEPSSASMRSYVEKNSIALLSCLNGSYNFPSCVWLGGSSPKREISASGLWNINYVADSCEEGFLKTLSYYAEETKLALKGGGGAHV